MKKKTFIIILVLFGLFVCCSCSKEARQKAKEARIAEKVELGKHNINNSPIRKIGSFHTQYTGNGERELFIKEIDGHEYLIIEGYRAVGICHYESCKYCRK